MNIKELIEELKKYDENCIVQLAYNDEYSEDVERVFKAVKDKRETRDLVIITNS